MCALIIQLQHQSCCMFFFLKHLERISFNFYFLSMPCILTSLLSSFMVNTHLTQVATAVLMQLEGLSLKEAWEQVKKAHHSAFPQPDNRAALVRYERLQLQAARDKQRAEKRRQQRLLQHKEETAANKVGAEALADSQSAVQELFQPLPLQLEHEQKEAATEGAPSKAAAASVNGRALLSGTGAPLSRSRANSTGGSRATPGKMAFGKDDDYDDDGEEEDAAAPLVGSMGADDFKAHGVDDAEQLSRYALK